MEKSWWRLSRMEWEDVDREWSRISGGTRAPVTGRYEAIDGALFRLFFRPAGECASGEKTHDQADAEYYSDCLIRAFANRLVSGLGAGERFFFNLTCPGFQQFLAIANDGFDVFQKSVQIHIVSVACFVSHDELMTRKTRARNGVFCCADRLKSS
jgi:hypothetical protein